MPLGTELELVLNLVKIFRLIFWRTFKIYKPSKSKKGTGALSLTRCCNKIYGLLGLGAELDDRKVAYQKKLISLSQEIYLVNSFKNI